MKYNTKYWQEMRLVVPKIIKLFGNPKIAWVRYQYCQERSSADIKARRGDIQYPHNIIFLAGMGLSGSSWLKNILGHIPGYYTRRTPIPYDIAYRQDICDSAFKYTSSDTYSLFKTHLNPKKENLDCIRRNGVDKIIVLYRDFRDVILSECHRLLKYPKPRDAYDFVDYQRLGFDKALMHLLKETGPRQVAWLDGWRQHAKKQPQDFHFLTFEELRQDTYTAYKRVLDFYQIQLSDDVVRQALASSLGRKEVLENIAESQVLPWARSSTFRRGEVGGWKEEFKKDHINLAKDKLGQALIDNGFETDFNW
ncbi:MAG: hypothetical protein HN353_06700 [Bdellovibrionales bacterium]|jgi:sulfotransferase 6B1|nr:hypothetical protein [Bdellovibrionales bacterium]MBT3525219.1 hypothetical protein [Bdellovibrionales bacterium]MBT7668255.1 hypothetical protein [Bdellovibrionales bacterium]